MGTRVTKIEFIRLLQIEKNLGTLAAMSELQEMQDGFTYGKSLVIRKCGDQDIEAVSMHWEFIPAWVKTMEEVKAARKQGIPWLNARSEKLLQSNMFSNAALHRRCLVLASHFYEWRHYRPAGAKKDLAYPYTIGVANASYFYMAGIWQTFTDKSTGETMDTFAIVTTAANGLIQNIHNTKQRMPTILTEALAYEWIMDNLPEDRIKTIASYQFSSENMFAHTIAKDFKTQEDPTAPYVYDELPSLDKII
jgi:putative SOS response-associated peptidase YedK